MYVHTFSGETFGNLVIGNYLHIEMQQQRPHNNNNLH